MVIFHDNYQERSYRNRISENNLKTFSVTVQESDLLIRADEVLNEVATSSIYKYRTYIESYMAAHPEFITSLHPIQCDYFAPQIVQDMVIASRKAGVGPMAAVAGAIAECVGKDLLKYSSNVIVENGGDIFIDSRNDIVVGISAGISPLSEKLSLLVKSSEMPMGICTSSGTIGHSLSFGHADAVCVKAKSVSLADAAATAIGNMMKSKHDVYDALQKGIRIEEVLGIVIIIDDQFGAIGNVELSQYNV